MIRYIDVKKVYPGNIVALSNISFQIDEGEFTFIIGPSGAGKSTLIRLLVRQELPSNGTIFFEDVEVPTIPNKLLSIYRQKLGIVFQDLKLIPTKTVLENIEFALEIAGKSEKEVSETTQYLMDVVNLKGRSHLFPHELSGGERQKVAIARALANDPKLVVADEPTGNLDTDTSFEILEILKAINNWGTTVIVITHDPTLTSNLKTRTITLKEGKILKDEGKKEKSKSAHNSLFAQIERPVRKKLRMHGIDSLEELLSQSEDSLEKVGLTDHQLKMLNEKIQNYLIAHK
ncbi:ATP-binding cassette domain-containing protein [bacterium]|nr:ATP-binding cassette domain-containing protein [bacterium]